MTIRENEQKICDIAQQAVEHRLSLKTTKTMLEIIASDDSEHGRFVAENLDEILETVENIYKITRKD